MLIFSSDRLRFSFKSTFFFFNNLKCIVGCHLRAC